MPQNTIMIKPKGTKYLQTVEEDLSRITIVLKQKYEMGHLIIETIDGEYDVLKNGVIVKRAN
jgi:hypothetical protein